MKYKLFIISIVLICSLIAFSACQSAETENSNADTSGETQFVLSSDESSAKKEFDDTARLEKKLELYGTENYFADAIVPHRYLIISENSVICVLFTADSELCNEVPKTSIDRIENQATGDFALIDIIDKTGTNISFCCSPDDMNDIITATK